jgi:hypothetical protein
MNSCSRVISEDPSAVKAFFRQGGLKLLVHAALRYCCMGPSATSVWGLKLLVYSLKKALSC